MNVKRFVWASIALFVFISLYEALVHGLLMRDLYKETASLWRDESTLAWGQRFVSFLLQCGLAIWPAYAFTQLYKEGGVANGLRFGLYFGVFAALLTASWYLWLPVSEMLGVWWFVTNVIEGLGLGLLLGLIYRR